MNGLELALGIAGGLTLARGAEIALVSMAKAREHAKMKEALQEAGDSFIDKIHAEMEAEKARDAAAPKKSARRAPAKKAPVKKPVAKAAPTTKKPVTAEKGK